MAKTFPLLILIFSMIGFPAVLHAQTPIRLSQNSSTDGEAGSHAGPPDVAAELGDSGDHFHAYADAAPTDPRERATIDHRFAPRGLVGSVGYRRSLDSRPIDADAAGPAAASGLGAPGGFVGAWLNYAF